LSNKIIEGEAGTEELENGFLILAVLIADNSGQVRLNA
jgi:hypothetical protein